MTREQGLRLPHHRAIRVLGRPSARATRRSGPQGVAQVASRAAALLRGGVPAGKVVSVLHSELSDVPELAPVADAVREGKSVSQALAQGPGAEWRILAAAWNLAEDSGAPLASALDQVADALRSLVKLQERRAVLLAGPRATVRLIALLPFLAVVLGTVMGFDPLGVLLSPLGYVLLAAGLFLLSLGILWARQLISRVERSDGIAGLEFTLCWIALGGGASIHAALVRVADGIDRARAEWVPFAALCDDRPLRTTVRTAATLGAPIAGLLLQEATAQRARAHAELEEAAEKLSIRVLLPLGVCALPSFIVLGVLPVVIAMLSPVLH